MRGTTAGFGTLALLGALLLAVPAQARAQTFDLRGQLSGWAAAKSGETRIGARYVPELSLAGPLSGSFQVSAQAALDAHAHRRFGGRDEDSSRADLDPYRLWVRLASPQFEARAGLQKISFGPAVLLRPLMWFDTVDPRDPLQLTDGVYGLLGRYYFLNNANVWAWALYGNDDLKGWETLPGDRRAVEFGGRVQVPVRAGEMGVSYHQRRVNPEGGGVGARPPAQGKFTEQRIGFDGKWDVGVGLWFEGTITRRGLHGPEPRYQRLLTVGTDYTFDVGNGPHVLFEQFMGAEARDPLGSGERRFVSALSADYPFSALDRVSAIVSYDWDTGGWSRFLTWRRAYDRWQIHGSAFWNPGRPWPARDQGAMSGFAGTGVHLLVAFNH